MLFKKKEQRSQQDNAVTSAPMRDGASDGIEQISKKGRGTDQSKSKDLISGQSDIEYPSGLKLALLLTSIFVGMFLSSLVR